MDNPELVAQCLKELRARWRKKLQSPGIPPGPLFHYAPAEAFRGIIQEGRIWLSNAAYLNDPNELNYPIAICRKVLDRPSGKRLLSLAEKGDEALFVRNTVLDQLAATVAHYALFKPWYTASFSLEGDQLSQWRAYCPTGGYAIGFNGSALSELVSKQFPLMFGAIEYDEAAQVQKIKEIIESQMTTGMDLRRRYQQEISLAKLEDLIINTMDTMLSDEFLFFKMHAFHEEQEWRLAFHDVDVTEKRSVKFRTRNGALVPYVEIDLRSNEKLPLQSVQVGPIGDQELLAHAAMLLLESKGYENASELIHTSSYRLR